MSALQALWTCIKSCSTWKLLKRELHQKGVSAKKKTLWLRLRTPGCLLGTLVYCSQQTIKLYRGHQGDGPKDMWAPKYSGPWEVNNKTLNLS